MQDLSYSEWEALKDLYGFYRLWKLKKWRFIYRWGPKNQPDYEALVNKGLAVRNSDFYSSLSRYKTSAKLTERFWAKVTVALLDIFDIKGQYQITTEGMAYCFVHGVWTFRDAIH